MPEQIQEILNRIRDWWNKFTRRQKTLIISLVVAVIGAAAILVFAVSRPETYNLITASSAKEASNIASLLSSEGILYTQSQDGLTFTINREDEAKASILLGTNDIPSNGYGISDVFDGSFSTTEADKDKKYQLYLEDRYKKQLATIEGVKSAEVNLSLPNNDGTILTMSQDAYASVILTLDGEMTPESAAGIANFMATTLGNEDADNILIMDSTGNVLYSGGDSSSITGITSSQLTLQQKLENNVKAQVKDIVIGTKIYDNCAVGLNLDVNWNSTNIVDHEYYVAEGNTQGYLESRSEYTEESTGDSAGTPGTTSNDSDTTYVLENGERTNTTISDIQENYLPSERITTTDGAVGTINYATSSISVVMTNYVMYSEETLDKQGKLEDTTFDEYIADISISRTDVDEDFYTAISNATGFPVERITVMAYDVPFFEYASGNGRSFSDYMQIALAVLIFIMLGVVVFLSVRKEKSAEEEIAPELSVDELLESTKESTIQEELEAIGYSEKSEARLLVERFVEEQPEAVAILLRNWLNDEWG